VTAFVFDGVLIVLNAVKIVSSFYMVQYEHVKRRVGAVCVSTSLGYVSVKNWQNWVTSVIHG